MRNIKLGNVYYDDRGTYIFIIQIKDDMYDQTIDVLLATYKDPIPSGGMVMRFDSEKDLLTKLNSMNMTFLKNIDVDGWMHYKRVQLINNIKGK